MNEELNRVYNHIKQAVCVEDIFGAVAEDESVKKSYRHLSQVIHPDRHNDPSDKEMAEDAFKDLSAFYQTAQKKLENGTYGTRSQEPESDTKIVFVIKTRKREYHIKSTLAQGDLSTVYSGDCLGGEDSASMVAVKVIEDIADNDLAQNELKVLRIFHSEPTAQSKHLPVLLDQFKTTEGQVGIILCLIDGYDLCSVHEKYPDGVPQKHVIWMLNRLLSAIGYVHSRGVIHGNIEPSHLMIQPRDHNLFLVDWSYSAINPFQSGDGFKIFNEDYSPPEVAEKKPPIPASDLYSIGKCMIYLLGGDVKNNLMPPSVNERLQRFIQFFVRESPLQRAQDAWEMHEKLIEMRDELWGQRFLEFKM